MSRKQTFWCVFENGNPIPGTVKYTRKDSIARVVNENYSWAKLKRMGCTCQKVEINIVER